MFPHMEYADIISDLRRTRSIMSTVDNILEDNLSTSPSRTSTYTPRPSSLPSGSSTWLSSSSAATSSSNGQKPVSQAPTQQVLSSATVAGSLQPTDSVEDRFSVRASTAASRSFSLQIPTKSVLTTTTSPEVEQCNDFKARVSNALQEGLLPAASSVSSRSNSVNPSQVLLTNNTGSQQQQQALTSVNSGDPENVLFRIPMPDSSPHFRLRSPRKTELEEVKPECSASATCQVYQEQVATEETITSVGPRTDFRALDGTGQSSVVGTGSVSLASGCCDVGGPTVYPAKGSYIYIQKDAVETFEDPQRVQQYDVNESNSLIGICDLGSDEGDEKYKQILQETCEESVPTFQNIFYDDGYSVTELGNSSGETSLRRRAVLREDEEPSTCGEWNLEKTNRKQWNNSSGQSRGENKTIMEHSSNMTHRRLKTGRGSALSPITHQTQEASVPRITAGDQETAGFGDSEDTTQRRQGKAGDVVVESAQGASMQAVGSFGGRFSKNPSERESLLLRRQQLLYSTARDRLLKGASSSGVGLCATDGAPCAILDSISASVDTASAVNSVSFGGAVINKTWEQVTGDGVILRDVNSSGSCGGEGGQIISSAALVRPFSPLVSSENGVTGDIDTGNR